MRTEEEDSEPTHRTSQRRGAAPWIAAFRELSLLENRLLRTAVLQLLLSF